IPGERIVGIKTGGKVIAHAIDCAALIEHEEHPGRWVDLKWDEDAAQLGGRTATIDVSLSHQVGALGAIATLIGDHRANIETIATIERLPDVWRLRVGLNVKDVKHMSAILSALEAQTIVTDVRRVRRPPSPAADAVEGPAKTKGGGAAASAPSAEPAMAEAGARRDFSA
ncbi:MAG: ACT domain-containing protein, partial [Pseudomonadota bacterium]